ncbi:MAG: ankyrin repeat domain-containing protein [Chloroflexota bacterium]
MSTGTGDFKQLLYAARDGDLESVQYWMRRGANPNFLHAEFLFAPLHISLRNGHLPVAQYLLENGADPHLAEGYSDTTPLSIAQAKGDAEALALLAAHGVAVETGLWQRVKQDVWRRWLKAFAH